MNWWSIIGLIADIIGAVMLFIGTEIINKAVTKILNSLSMNQGRNLNNGGLLGYLGGVFELHALEKSKKESNIWSRIGLLLIIMGFFLQFMGTIIK